MVMRQTGAHDDERFRPTPEQIDHLRDLGQVSQDEMMRTFNMGIGLIIVTGHAHAEPLIDELAARGGHNACVIGEIVPGEPPSVAYR